MNRCDRNPKSQRTSDADGSDLRRSRAYDTINDFNHSLLDSIKRYDILRIAQILTEVEGRHCMGALVLSALLSSLYVFHRNRDVPATIWSVIKLGVISFLGTFALVALYIGIVKFCDNPFYGEDEDVRPGKRMLGALILLAACMGISALFIFGVLA